MKFEKLQFGSESELARICEEYRKEKEKYNGWSNYATWRVNLEIVDPVNYEKGEYYREFEDINDLANIIEENCYSFIGDEAGGGALGGICLDYALTFLSDVNWYEIASNMVEDNKKIIISNK